MVTLHSLVLLSALSVTGDTGLLLKFSASWCGPCRSMEPTVQRLIAEGYPLRDIDVDQQQALVARFGVSRVPCFVMLADGREVDRIEGATSYARLKQMFETAKTAQRSTTSPATPPNAAVESVAAVEPIAAKRSAEVRGQSPDADSVPGAKSSSTSNSGPAGLLSALAGAGKKIWPGSKGPASSEPPPPASPPEPLRRNESFLEDTRSANSPAANPRDVALQATVRIKISEGRTNSVGTGTIIDMHGDEALVLTCGHIFRDSRGQGKITVELFAPGTAGPVSGKLVAYDADKMDCGLIAIRTNGRVTPVRVAPAGYRVRPGEPVFSVGCDRGAEPSVRNSRVTAVNKYDGAPNLEVKGQPVDGRSGGGLFSAEGWLIGVCNAADPADDEGLYAALPVVHWQLAQIGQQRLFERTGEPTPLVAVPDRGHSQAAAPRRAATSPPEMSPRMPLAPPGLSASNDRPVAGSEPTEIICIVRSKHDPQGKREVLVLDNPSADLLNRLNQESRRGSPESPIVRGQSER